MSKLWTQRTTAQQRTEIRQLDRAALQAYQLQRLNRLLDAALPANEFYAAKLADFGSTMDSTSLQSLDQLAQWPPTTKQELNSAANDVGYAANLTWPVDQYARFHRTSGTRGRPMIVLDTHDDWQWWMEGWQYVLDAVELSAEDRVVMAFSFGPFIGFWSAFDAVAERRALLAPTGAMTTVARLELIQSIEATVLFCTPSYALHLIEAAGRESVDLRQSAVRAVVVAGEPGGSVPTVRERIEQGFAAKVIDHSGASEVGPWGFPDSEGQGVHVNEAEFVAEFESMETRQPAIEGELSELILTTLGRVGCPVIRYRTGDLVRPVWSHSSECEFVWLDGGVLGRTDDMLIIRGVNIFPSSIEAILRGFSEVVEFRLTASRESSLDQLAVEVEDELNQPQRIAQALQSRLGLRIDVQAVPAGTLPRFEGKGKRFVDRREDDR